MLDELPGMGKWCSTGNTTRECQGSVILIVGHIPTSGSVILQTPCDIRGRRP